MSASQAVHYEVEAERALLGALLLNPPPSTSGVAARGLRASHFYLEQHGTIFEAMLRLAERDRQADPITVRDEIERMGVAAISAETIEALAGYTYGASNYDAYADRVSKLATWRERLAIGDALAAAAARRDDAAWARTLTEVDRQVFGARTETYSPEALGALLWSYFADGVGANPHAVPSPFARLTDALGGGLWPGEVMLLSGHTHHGKSAVADAWGDFAADRGIQTHLYMTEMTAMGRGMRYLARRTGVPFMAQRRRDLTDRQRKAILDELGKIAYGMSVVSDWDPEDIVRDALRARHRFVIVDLIHGFHYADERELDRISKAMQRLARVSTTIDGHPGTAVLAVAHVGRVQPGRDGKLPPPTLSSLKGAASLEQDTDFALFIHQEQEEGGAPSGKGKLYMPKGRGGEPFTLEVELNRRRFRFEVPEQPEQDRLAGVNHDGKSMAF